MGIFRRKVGRRKLVMRLRSQQVRNLSQPLGKNPHLLKSGLINADAQVEE
jgi:hypothetical protein